MGEVGRLTLAPDLSVRGPKLFSYFESLDVICASRS